MQPVIEVQMLIRKSIENVYEAFVDPEITTQFWFTQSSGRVEQGAELDWKWTKYNVTAKINVLNMIKNELIQMTWDEGRSKVDFIFEKISNDTTYLKIRNYDIQLQDQALIEYIIDATGGFTTVIDAAKAWLEHQIKLNLVDDKFL